MTEVSLVNYELCPAGNICAKTSESADDCGTTTKHFSPLQQPEQLCSRALRKNYSDKLNSPTDSPIQESQQNWQLAWLCLENGLLVPDSKQASDSFDDARIYAERSLQAPVQSAAYTIDSKMLLTFLPRFRARRKEFPETKTDLTGSLIDMYELAISAPTHTNRTHPDHFASPDHQSCFYSDNQRGRTVQKIAFLLLCERFGVTAFPAPDYASRVRGTKRKDRYDVTVFSDNRPVPVITAYSSAQPRLHEPWSMAVYLDKIPSPVEGKPFSELIYHEAKGQLDNTLWPNISLAADAAKQLAANHADRYT